MGKPRDPQPGEVFTVDTRGEGNTYHAADGTTLLGMEGPFKHLIRWTDQCRGIIAEAAQPFPVVHAVTFIWQERAGEYSYRCACGVAVKHQRFGDLHPHP